MKQQPLPQDRKRFLHPTIKIFLRPPLSVFSDFPVKIDLSAEINKKETTKPMRKIIVFMRGKYCLEEIGNSKDELTFLTIFGKKERECFEIQNSRFSKYVHDNHDNSKTYHDGKWMFVDGNTLEQLEEVKKLTRIRKKPGRKPFPKEKAIYSQSGQRCDFCVDYVHTSEEQRTTMENPSSKIWKKTDWRMRCEGCYSDNCHCKDEPCGAK